MLALATTRISVYRGTTTDEYGDEVDTEDPLFQGIPASLMEKRQRVFDPVTSTPRIVRSYVLRVGSNTPIKIEDRIMDEKDNAIYAIENITEPTGPAFTGDLRLDLTKIN